MSEEQPVQMEDQAGIQRAPVLEQVVLGGALCAASVRDDNTFDRGRRGDALDTSPVSNPGI